MKGSLLLLAGSFGLVSAAAAAPPFGGEEIRFDDEKADYGPLSLYGDFRYSIAANDRVVDSGLDTEDNASRLGVGGKIGAFGQTSVFYNISFQNESDVGGSDSVRDLYAGFRGGWGEVYAGKRRTAYAEVTRWIDPFYDASTATSRMGANFGASGFTDDAQGLNEVHQDDQLGFRSGWLGPVKINAALFSDDSTADDDFGVEAGVMVGMPFGDGGQWAVSSNILWNDDVATVQGIAAENWALKLAGGVDFGGCGFGLQFERLDVEGNSRHPYYGTASGWVGVGRGRVAVSVGWQQNAVLDGGSPGTDFKAHGTQDGWGGNIGYFADFTDNIGFRAIVSYLDIDDVDEEVFTISVGANFRFNVSLI